MYKRIFLGCFIIIVFTGLTACSTVGYQTARHNGKLYYIPENCEQYSYSFNDSDRIQCVHNGIPTGQVLLPADPAQVDAYLRQEQENRKAWDEINQNLQKMGPKTTNTNCYNVGSMLSCNSTTY